jgi:hypothetical protein
MRRPKTIRELEQELLVATRRFLSEGDHPWSCKFADLADMRDIKDLLEDREALVRAWVNGTQDHSVWECNHREATPEELEASRKACIEAALKQAGIPVDTEPPTDYEIEDEYEYRVQEYAEALREWYTP